MDLGGGGLHSLVGREPRRPRRRTWSGPHHGSDRGARRELFLDIQAETDDGLTVIVENQLARTDHGHLGQLIVYASGLEAAVVIWVAPDFRDEHRRALDWLNERTDNGVNFFGVQIGVVQIGTAGPRAPVFDIVARPNAWQKDVKETTSSVSAINVVTPLNAARQDFFADVMADVVSARPNIRAPRRGRDSWISFASGPFGYWAISLDRDNTCYVEAYIDIPDKALNKALFDQLYAEAGQWEGATGLPLRWLRRDDVRHSRIGVRNGPISLDDDEARNMLRGWAVDAAVRMYDALNETLRTRARTLREAANL